MYRYWPTAFHPFDSYVVSLEMGPSISTSRLSRGCGFTTINDPFPWLEDATQNGTTSSYYVSSAKYQTEVNLQLAKTRCFGIPGVKKLSSFMARPHAHYTRKIIPAWQVIEVRCKKYSSWGFAAEPANLRNSNHVRSLQVELSFSFPYFSCSFHCPRPFTSRSGELPRWTW